MPSMAAAEGQQHSIDRVHSAYQFAFILVDFSAAALFVVGSVLFFYPEWVDLGTWMFLVGSIFFAVKPTLRLARYLHIRTMARRTEVSMNRALEKRHFF